MGGFVCRVSLACWQGTQQRTIDMIFSPMPGCTNRFRLNRWRLQYQDGRKLLRLETLSASCSLEPKMESVFQTYRNINKHPQEGNTLQKFSKGNCKILRIVFVS
ncbi:hypothetical protein NPIL_70761 [Nephila pilipes]|uniref:Uncharacterized protein n=1 Tax=Nephila pilipes TaxID=299642 RepID=A0A8X6N0X3_NEPPI|nr:hypothetical protein NPIL_70761 [Nephila pilipes]